MNTVKDFTLGQRVATTDGDGEITKIGRKYVYVQVDGADKPGQYLPEDLKVSLTKPEQPVVVVLDEMHQLVTTGTFPAVVSNTATISYDNPAYAPTPNTESFTRPPMKLKGKRADADNRRAARKAQRKSRRANRR
jgi:hypothetical protein